MPKRKQWKWPHADRREACFKRIRFIRSSSAPLSPSLQREFLDKFKLRLIQAMGSSEAGNIFSNPQAPGENKIGPSLAGVFGRKIGTEPGYSYSSAMKGANVTWNEKTLDDYLQGPSKFVRGTKMVYSVPNEKDRQDVIAYLKTLSK